ncbi:unnamed protein product, partial [Rotaria sp. Silwood1]
RFHISNDKHELSLSEPITFKQLTLKSIEFEYVDDNRKTIQIIEISSHQSINKSIRLNVKTISFDKLPAKNNVNYLHIWNHLKIIFDEYEFINAYIQNRLDKLKIEEKIIELIIPILDKQYDDISIDQIEYKREQSNMDNLLNTMKSFLQLDEQLTKHRKTQTIGSLEIQKLENDLIQQLIRISIQLNDPLIIKQVKNLTNHMQDTQLLNELRPIILSG